MSAYLRYPLPTGHRALSRSALPDAPQVPVVQPRPSRSAVVLAAALRRLAHAELSLARRFDPRRAAPAHG